MDDVGYGPAPVRRHAAGQDASPPPAGDGPQQAPAPAGPDAPSDAPPGPPWSLAPLGFEPDALGFAVRTALALLLAYYLAFFAQVSSASSAGICVAIVAQPSVGMTTSKAVFRTVGTLVGGMIGLLLLSAFPQDRTAALCGFTLWLGVCTFAAVLLRDFRAYGAALSGYTVGIIVLGAIDAPGTAWFVALDRVAAILIGIAAVLVVNLLGGAGGAYDALVRDLRSRSDAMAALAEDALRGRPLDGDLDLVRLAAGAAALQTQASYAAVEMPGGRIRANGARHVIAALLGMVSASRAVAAVAGPDTPPAVRAYLRRTADAMRMPDTAGPGAAPWPATPADALLLERADELLACQRGALLGLRTLTEGTPALPRVRLQASHDLPAAMAATVRVMLAVGLCASFCVLSGWSGATLVLIQESAFVALFATLPNPAKASLLFGASMLPAIPAVLLCKFLLLPSASGYVPFSLAVGGLMFAGALAVRHRVAAPYAATLPLMLALLLSPTNTQTFDFAGFWNTALQVALSAVFTTAVFATVLQTVPSRRLAHLAVQVALDLRRTLRRRRLLDRAAAQSLLYDRMAKAIGWLGAPAPGRTRLLRHIYGMGEMDLALRRAHSGLAAVSGVSEARAAVDEARRSLSREDVPAMLDAAQALLDHPDPDRQEPLRQAASGLAGAAFLLRPERATVRFRRRVLA